jgi:hypothetical protein
MICLGFKGTEGKCKKEAGTKWSPYWCAECNQVRLDHLDKQMEALHEFFDERGYPQ